MKPREERPLKTVPKSTLVVLAFGLSLQILWHAAVLPKPQARAKDLLSPPSSGVLRLASFGDPTTLAKLLMLYVQSFDVQPGIMIPYAELDYAVIEKWLSRILQLDKGGQYPLFVASRLYAEVPIEAKQRLMLDFIYREFLLDPDRRWPSLAHAALIAKHRLKDLPLALKYTEAIRKFATAKDVPDWARQMSVFILEDMNELESAKILLGALLTSGRISDPAEAAFLRGYLEKLE